MKVVLRFVWNVIFFFARPKIQFFGMEKVDWIKNQEANKEKATRPFKGFFQ